MHKTVVLNVVGLTRSLIGEHTPRLARLARESEVRAIGSMLPAVTCSVQATYVTGARPSEHGIVGNGWYFRDECEVKLWRQSNHLVQRPKVWERARELDPEFTCANLFWWFNMYSSVDFSATPRPMYPADGRKIPDVYTRPGGLRDELQAELGQFPLFQFWGPATSIKASEWIAQAAQWVDRRHEPTLTLVYLPHLDYGLQRYGPSDPRIAADLTEVDLVVGRLLDHYEGRGARVLVVSEYGIEAVDRPVHLNRVLREAGLVAVRDERGHDMLDPGASEAFAVADHQVAHVYVRDPARVPEVAALLRAVPGVERVLEADGKREAGLDHSRAGELVVVADPGAWFTYYFWDDDGRAPDYARTVDIHRKPGYDPVELFIDPALRAPKLDIAWTLLRRKLGFRDLLDVIPLDASLVRGSHGRPASSEAMGPLLMTRTAEALPMGDVEATGVFDVILRHLTGERAN
ncbi:MAG: alkaline phosphatase family protein [Chloroflexota bacterium]